MYLTYSLSLTCFKDRIDKLRWKENLFTLRLIGPFSPFMEHYLVRYLSPIKSGFLYSKPAIQIF